MKPAALMLGIGAGLWLAFLGAVNCVAALGVPYQYPELAAIPMSMTAYFVLVSRFVFRQRLTWGRFWRFAALSLVCWLAFHAAVVLALRVGVPLLPATITGAGANALMNVVVQRRFTFGKIDTEKNTA